jgi:uncharacterized protein
MRRSTRFGMLLAAAAIAAGLAGLPSQAQRAPDPAQLAAARELFEASGGVGAAERVVEEIIAGMVNQMRQANPAAAAEFERVMRTILSPRSPKVQAYFNDIMEVTTNFYAENFTIEELRDLTAFQRSAVGQKFQRMLPQAMARMGPALMKFQASVAPDVQDAMRRSMGQTGPTRQR